jgi:tRNA pseudouridine55 synthase
MDGFLLVDKTGGMTSHDVVARIRRRFATKKVGHAGTLDPMATGVLVLGIGNATRLLQYVVDGVKAYDATISLGAATVTYDVEGEVLSTASPAELSLVTDNQISEILRSMVGVISQRPSSVSAIKVDGKRAHQRVRDGEIVELPAREVTIEAIGIHTISRTETAILINVSVRCSAGTYIRSIARDLGQALNVGGHLVELRRTLVSPFDLSECAPWEDAVLQETAVGIAKILPTRTLDNEEFNEISFGRTIPANEGDGVTAALTQAGNFTALLENRELGKRKFATPIMVVPTGPAAVKG